jgi:hypothetical protein
VSLVMFLLVCRTTFGGVVITARCTTLGGVVSLGNCLSSL